MSETKALLILAGPTASGKTELSLCLAKKLGCEIVSADSMLVYKGMDIGTAKPSAAVRRRTPHYLIDLVSPRSAFSVFDHRQRALRALREIHKKGKVPLLVGGGGLYLAAIWKGLSPHPGGDAVLRKKLKQQVRRSGLKWLYEKLRRIDPARAQKIHPHDERRILRALEITGLSGKTPSQWYQARESLRDLGYSVQVIGLRRDRVELYQRINDRVKSMFGQGLIEEVKRLNRKGLSKTARQALGYREVLEYLKQRKRRPEAKRELIELIQKRTRHFAKRQLTWLRREKAIQWVDWQEGEPPQRVCDRIVSGLRNG